MILSSRQTDTHIDTDERFTPTTHHFVADVILCVCSDLIEEILSPEEDEDGGVRFGGNSCCNSSHFSDNNKSEKNMSDFEGEGVLSDEEIVTLSRSMTAAHDHMGTHAMPSSPNRIPGVAAMYQKHRLHPAVDSAQGWPSLWLGSN